MKHSGFVSGLFSLFHADICTSLADSKSAEITNMQNLHRPLTKKHDFMHFFVLTFGITCRPNCMLIIVLCCVWEPQPVDVKSTTYPSRLVSVAVEGKIYSKAG